MRATTRVENLRVGDRILTGQGIGTVKSIMRNGEKTSLVVRTNEGGIRTTVSNKEVVFLP